jgi:CheY-like chemotaxis protein
MTEIKYDIRRGADIYREIYRSRLGNWISKGKIQRGEVLVWRSGLGGWRRPEELEELIPFFERWDKIKAEREDTSPRLLKKPILVQKRIIKNILIIDDEKDLCSLLGDALSEKNHDVSIANTKKEALSCLKRKAPDLVFLDLKLPDGDGLKILSQIKKIHPAAIVNIISAYGSEESKEEAKKKGAYTFIDKPFSEKEILKSIKEISGGGGKIINGKNPHSR